MLPDQILYGRADEYLYDLIDSSFNVKFSDNILYEILKVYHLKSVLMMI